ncbi:3-oxoacyl-(acyl-carrier-protein) synthase [Georgfuchsia toluolica]|uniref:3-oxoacyl-(Acyl-carrier-protein) synthase n=1 Tax=Georgfuchsia toluolica TaxID=424218 RepID=A0A916J3S8_9PROT|nr:beta-ketoacyl synthase chain length factor [Georgfuchsia toluolica]CAG4883458.1 3-oxoacyl-(acyl-carrier-protein) synthase [Georgfuchsia toluolica]
MRIFVEAVGVLAPGLKNWDSARPVLAGEQAFVAAPLELVTPACLPPAERRRSSANVRLAIATAEQALNRTPLAPQDMAMVFSSAEASGVITHQLCEVLADSREVSPTLFHNSVHNAPSGYYSIAMKAKLAASSVCHSQWSFAAGLLNAAAQALADNVPVLYVCYDSPMPPPLYDVMPVQEATAIALVLTPTATSRSMAGWEITLDPGNGQAPWPDWLPPIWHDNASARGFAALATLENPGRGVATFPLSHELSLKICRC